MDTGNMTASVPLSDPYKISHLFGRHNLSCGDTCAIWIWFSGPVRWIGKAEFEGILKKGPYLPCVSMAGGALLAGYPQNVLNKEMNKQPEWGFRNPILFQQSITEPDKQTPTCVLAE